MCMTRLFVTSLYPGASEAEIKYNQDVAWGRAEATPEATEHDVAEDGVYGSGPGGWVLSAQDRDDIQSLKSKSPSVDREHFTSFESLSAVYGAAAEASGGSVRSLRSMRSSVLSPRGETSGKGVSPGSGWSNSTGSLGPVRKRARRGSRPPPLVLSPFLVKAGGEENIVTVSSSSSASSGLVSVRKGKAFIFVDDLAMEVIRMRTETEGQFAEITEEIEALEMGAEIEEGDKEEETEE